MTQAISALPLHDSYDSDRWSGRVSRMLMAGHRVAIWGCDAQAIRFIRSLERGGYIPYVIDPLIDHQGMKIPGLAQTVQPPDALVECGPIAPVCVLVLDGDAYEHAEQTIAALGLNASVLLVQ